MVGERVFRVVVCLAFVGAFSVGILLPFVCPYTIVVASFLPVHRNNLHWLTYRLDTCKYSGLDITTTIFQLPDIPNHCDHLHLHSKSSQKLTTITQDAYLPYPDYQAQNLSVFLPGFFTRTITYFTPSFLLCKDQRT